METPVPWSVAVAEEVIERHLGERGPLLVILHDLQEAFGYIDAAALPLVATALNLSRAEVHGVVTFYHDFRQEPGGTHTLRICRAESCQAMGAEHLINEVTERLGIKLGETTADGELTVEQVFCLGNCALSPAAMLDGHLIGRASQERLMAEFGAAGARAAMTTLYVPRDAAARSVGADAVVEEIERVAAARGEPLEIVRTGSRGLFFLEPLVEVATATGRVAYGPVAPADVASLFDAGFLAGGSHPLAHGATEEIPYLARQHRVTFARVGVIDPLSIEEYEAAGGLAGLRRALELSPDEVVTTVTESGLRGRGGAGFPTGIKWRTVLDAVAAEKFVCCNADEGDSGTFADRMLMEGDPFTLIEGMTIAAIAVGAASGYVYIRSEYPDAVATMTAAIEIAELQGVLGASVLGSGRPFTLKVRVGAGAYICGEETSMLESLEGRRGQIRAKPPLPAHVGLFASPTVINNVLSFAAVPDILANGAAHYADLGVGRSRGTQVFQLGGNIAHGGIVELAFGVTLRELVEDFGGGTASRRPLRAVQVGGPLGAYLPETSLDLPMDYEAFAAVGAMVGHGGIVVFDDTVDMAQQARFAMEFCAEESCGKCTPCRIGSVRGVEVIDKIIGGVNREANFALLEDLCELMTDGSLCAMGGLTPMPVRSAYTYFREDFERPPIGASSGRDERGGQR